VSNQSIKTHLETIMDSIEAQGYIFTNEVFDFDSVPASIMNKAYRITVETEPILEEVGRVQKHKRVSVWLAYRFGPKGTRAKFLDIVDHQDTMEDDIIAAIAGFPTEITGLDMDQAFNGDYIIYKITATLTYWRNI
jgi:hypothetical protein